MADAATEAWHLKDFVQPVVTIFATFVGATLAFVVAEIRSVREEKRRRRGAINTAIVTVFRMHLTLSECRKQVLAPYEHSDEGWLRAPISPVDRRDPITFDAAELAFLLNEGQGDLYTGLMLVSDKFETIVSVLQKREDLILSSVHPVVHQTDNLTLADRVPTREAHLLQALYALIKEEVPVCLAGTQSLYDRLRTAWDDLELGKVPPMHLPFNRETST